MTQKIPAANVKLKRAYDPPAPNDGTRVLVTGSGRAAYPKRMPPSTNG